ncbi:hypothetical protein K0M31_004067 [Melipona bicolor]|uniref:Uncharacterized protein n=1 Tax=Melipona bicolor TaxID=60889 RepID=A0AA40FYR8_9HYME|nr:hypothetical protein K0M31_004067 [Melipona bicolor]
MLTRGTISYEGKRVYESVLSGRGGSKRWLLLNTGCHLLTVALSSSHWFPVKCIAKTRYVRLENDIGKSFFHQGSTVIPFVTRSTRDSRDACFLASVVSAIPCCVPARIEGTDGHVPTSQDDGDDNDFDEGNRSKRVDDQNEAKCEGTGNASARVSNCFAALHDVVVLNDEAGC